MKSEKYILTILFIVALYYLPACSDRGTPSSMVAKDYFLKQCITDLDHFEVDNISDLKRRNKVDFEIIAATQIEKRYILGYRANIDHLKDPYSDHNKGSHYYEGHISFIKEGKSWIPQDVEVFGHDCKK
jgi:hypothetical protein